MHPAFSVIFLTTLSGVGQGLFLVLYALELGAAAGWLPSGEGTRLQGGGSVLALLFLIAGLAASFFHLGRPERAWRAVMMWRTSWLSREVIVLPAFMAAVAAYGAMHVLGFAGTLLIGGLGAVLCVVLFICTGMIYACLKFLQEWATPLTVLNFTLLGCASGCTLAVFFAALVAPWLVPGLALTAILLTVAAGCGRGASLVRNARIRPRSDLQTATGIRHPRIVQKSQGFMGGSFNTREFFHGRPEHVVRMAKGVFLLLVFPVPVVLLAMAGGLQSPALAAAAFVAQYLGLIAERWFFFAQARHPQNLYYQAMS